MARSFQNSAEIRKFIAAEIAPGVARGSKLHAECRSKMMPELTKLVAANKGGEAAIARLHARALVQMIRQAELALGYFKEAQALIDEVSSADGPDFSAEIATLDKLLKSIAEPTRQLDLWIKLANQQIAASEKLDKETRATEDTAMEEWSRFAAYCRQRERHVDAWRAEAARTESAANKAAGERDAAALAKAKADAGKLTTLMSKDPPHEMIERGMAKFAKEHEVDKFSPGFAAQYKRDVAELKALFSRLQAGVTAAFRATGNAMETLMLDPDAGKAIRVLGLKSDQLAKMKKALAANESVMQRELDAIAKDAGLKTTGKEMAARLRRERVL